MTDSSGKEIAPTGGDLPVSPKRRDELLLKMYEQAYGNINRQLGYVWQSVGVIAGALAAVIAERSVSIDLPTLLFVIVAGWFVAHLIDANSWANRNFLIITNIEREFLLPTDATDIHYLFEQHRGANKLIGHLNIQLVLALALVVIVLGHHHHLRVYPACLPRGSALLPYAGLLAVSCALIALYVHSRKQYLQLLARSPGKPVDSRR